MIADLTLTGTTASKADIRIRDKVNEMIAVLNALVSSGPVPSPIIEITAEQEAAIMAVMAGGQFTLMGPLRAIVCRVGVDA